MHAIREECDSDYVEAINAFRKSSLLPRPQSALRVIDRLTAVRGWRLVCVNAGSQISSGITFFVVDVCVSIIIFHCGKYLNEDKFTSSFEVL